MSGKDYKNLILVLSTYKDVKAISWFAIATGFGLTVFGIILFPYVESLRKETINND